MRKLAKKYNMLNELSLCFADLELYYVIGEELIVRIHLIKQAYSPMFQLKTFNAILIRYLQY